jgi:hypothetical protein
LSKYIRKADRTEDFVDREEECDEDAPKDKVKTVEEEGNHIVTTTVIKRTVHRVKHLKTGEEQVVSKETEEYI